MQSLKNKSLFSVFIFFYGVVLRIMEELEYNQCNVRFFSFLVGPKRSAPIFSFIQYSI